MHARHQWFKQPLRTPNTPPAPPPTPDPTDPHLIHRDSAPLLKLCGIRHIVLPNSYRALSHALLQPLQQFLELPERRPRLRVVGEAEYGDDDESKRRGVRETREAFVSDEEGGVRHGAVFRAVVGAVLVVQLPHCGRGGWGRWVWWGYDVCRGNKHGNGRGCDPGGVGEMLGGAWGWGEGGRVAGVVGGGCRRFT